MSQSPLYALGLNHLTAPLDIRERVVFHVERLREALTDMKQGLATEAAILSTCNRTELYFAGERPAAAAELAGEHPRGVVAVGELPSVLADRTLLKQVWLNLIGNALKYSGPREAPRIEVAGAAEGGHIVYAVRDNGVGIDMRYASKLFGVFQRLHRQDECPGTGVGLAIVQRIVSRHGGRVWAEGSPGEGACFRFSLPEG